MSINTLLALEFDNFSISHWKEKDEGKIDKTLSFITYEEDNGDLEDGKYSNFHERIVVYTDKEPGLHIECYRDMWGTYITFRIGDKEQTIAQEDETMSFIDAFVTTLNKMKNITDVQTKTPKDITEEFNSK